MMIFFTIIFAIVIIVLSILDFFKFDNRSIQFFIFATLIYLCLRQRSKLKALQNSFNDFKIIVSGYIDTHPLSLAPEIAPKNTPPEEVENSIQLEDISLQNPNVIDHKQDPILI